MFDFYLDTVMYESSLRTGKLNVLKPCLQNPYMSNLMECREGEKGFINLCDLVALGNKIPNLLSELT